MLKAEEARSLGLVTRVVPDQEFEAGLGTFAAELADRPPIALAATKQGVAHAYDYGSDDYAGEEHWAFETYQTADVQEGFAALAERRKPVFIGK
jgi:enoyl-CoA hydratase/carnithine racemase